MTTPMTSDEIRESFLDYFSEMRHEVLASSPLVPPSHLNLLFTNAGMNQFVDALLGLETRSYRRAATAQKCMRVSGKQNDLQNVGPSPRHHTFFEMLGNFSFGDYFKEGAIRYAWQYLTRVLNLPVERLWVTVHDSDDEAEELWKAHVDPARILRFDEDNFWSMGETGPCGPCSEIFYYRGPLEQQDGARGVNVEDDYLEIWNLVFMQYDRGADGTLAPLPFQSIDTGMGLERLAQVLQDVDSNYDTDLFLPILARIQSLLGDSDQTRDEKTVGYRVIADHVRAVTFLVSEGVLPGNEGRAYVLRLILRRALRFGKLIGFDGPFIAEVADAVIDKMGGPYPALRERRDFILEVMRKEEAAFQRTLDRGIRRLDELIADCHAEGGTMLSGEEVFRLYDTYGFPFDLTQDIAREQGLEIDRDGYDQAMAEQRARARAAGGFNIDQWAERYRRLAGSLPPTEFVGYDSETLADYPLRLAAIVDPESGERIEAAAAGQEVDLILDRSPFYAESGGQVADTGRIESEYGRALVEDVRRPVAGVTVHRATVVSGSLRQGESATATVDVARRQDVMRNHTATHLLHRALRDTLGEHAQQRGSLVAPDYLRFDFNHLDRVDEPLLDQIEQTVNQWIRRDAPVQGVEMSLGEAQAQGATMLFGEKYGDEVRVISILPGESETTPYSQELCGGTHLQRTGEIGAFVIAGEQSVSAGTRRIVALTGRAAETRQREQRETLARLERLVGAQQPTEIEERVLRLQRDLAERERELQTLERRLGRQQGQALLDEVQTVAGLSLIAARVEVGTVEQLREMADWLRDHLGSAVVVLAAVVDERPLLIAAATPDVVARGAHAGNLVREVAQRLGGGGGGRPDLAQAGGRDADALPDALAAVPDLLAAQLK